MLKHPNLTETRIAQFIKHPLEIAILGPPHPLKTEFCQQEHPDQQQAMKGKYQNVEPGFRWGPAWKTVWFRCSGVIPRSWQDKRVVAILETGGERTLWKGNVPICGADDPHPYVLVTPNAKGGERVELYVQAYGGNPSVRVHGHPAPDDPLPFILKEASIRTFDHELWQLYLDFRFYFELAKTLNENDVARAHIIRGLNEAINVFDLEKRATLAEAKRIVKEACSAKRVDRYHTLTPIGHAHLDTAWLWPLHITMKKMAHTTATQLALMNEYPEYVFAHSQASQYKWLQEQYPKLFERVKDKVSEGQWEPVGSMWVESDTNLISGESLVRQFLYGIRYFQEHFGINTRDMWLPDVFGYSAALPQILSKFGIEYFMTQKISWNEFNRFPHNTFWWQGIDGSRIWTHFPPADTYTGMCTPEQLRKHLFDNRDAARNDMGLYVFGYGDGGGGPTAEHIEFLRRAARAPGMPQIKWQSAKSFFKEAKENSRDLPVWAGELYFEYHRGTYTTQAQNKDHNRRCEFMLRDAEYLACFTPGFPKSYPHSKIESLWKRVLLLQFHDILPGTSVREVYEDSEKEYNAIKSELHQLIETSIRQISEKANTASMKRPIALFHFADVVSEGRIKNFKGDPPQSILCGDQSLPVQAIEMFGEKQIIFAVPEAALGKVAIADLQTEPPIERPRLKGAAKKIENDQWAVRFDAHGNITSVISLEDQTEFIQQGALANVFQVFEDKPTKWSAWDVDAFAWETCKELLKSERFELVEKGPVRVAVELEKKFGNSRIRQRISLGPTPGIRFDTEIDWHENEKMLKTAFPVNVNASHATYEIQFGNIQRPTHMNTSWDLAKFEVCAHKWVDLSEGDHGVALLNNAKYGHDIHENVIRLTMLRSPKAPDPLADMGIHRFTYVLLPHFGPYHWAGIVRAGIALNAQTYALSLPKHKGIEPSEQPYVCCEDRNVIIESVKKAEDSNHIIVRLYECHNSRGTAELSCTKPVKSAYTCGLMENEIEELTINEGMIQFDYKPFEIITIKLIL